MHQRGAFYFRLMLSKHKNYLLLHLIVIIYGFTGLLGDLISLESVDKTWYRMIIAAIGIGLFMLMRPPRLKVTWKRKAIYFGIGLLIAAHWITFFEAIEQGTISLTLACLSSATLFVALIEPLIFKRKVQPYEIILGLFVIAGLALIFNFEGGHQRALIIAIISAALVALFTVFNGKLMQGKNDPTAVSFYEMLGGAVGITVYLLVTSGINESTFDVSAYDWLWLLVLGLVCTSFAFIVGVAVMKELTPFTNAIVLNLEPIYGIIIALTYSWEKEYMSTGFYLGTTVILASIFVNAYFKKRLRTRDDHHELSV